MGVLSFLSGAEGEVELIKKLTKIGKNASSDIVVSGLTIGQTAATISKYIPVWNGKESTG